MLSLIASTLIVAPDYKIQMGKTIPAQHLCGTLLTAQKTFTGYDGRISNYHPCTIELGAGDGACVLRKRTAYCWLYNKPSATLPRPRIAGFTPDYTPPPKGQPIGNGTRFLAFVPLGQINPIGAIVEWFAPKPKAKPKAKPKPKPTWADREECVNKELHRQITNQEKVNKAAARKACGG